MRIFFLTLLYGFLFLIVKTALLSFFLPSYIIPDIILILVFYISFTLPSWKGALLSFIFGFMVDLFSGGTPGVHSFSLTSIFFILYLLSKRVDLDILFVKVTGAALLVIANFLIVFLVLRYVGGKSEMTGIFFYFILPNALITGGTSPLFFYLLNKFNQSNLEDV